MSLSSKSTIVLGIALILILAAVAVLVIRVLRLQQKMLDLEKHAVTEKQRLWLLNKQKASMPPEKSVRDTVLDVLMEIEQLKKGIVVEPEEPEVPEEPEQDGYEEFELPEIFETKSGAEPAESCNDPRSRPFSILTSITSMFGGGGVKAAAAARPEIFEIVE